MLILIFLSLFLKNKWHDESTRVRLTKKGNNYLKMLHGSESRLRCLHLKFSLSHTAAAAQAAACQPFYH